MIERDALKIAVIGGGNIAGQHLPVLKDLPEARVVALVDSDPRVLQNTADRYEISGRWLSHTDMLEREKPDAVFVLVSVLHVASVAADFIRSGVPTFLEKPPGLYTADTRELADLALQNHTLAMVGVNRRFYSVQLRGRERLLDTGPVQSVAVEAHEDVARVRANPKFSEEVLRRWSAANGIHALDMLRFFGGDVSGVTVAHRTVEGPMFDCCSALLEFGNGAIGRALMDWFGPGGHRYEVRTEGATLTSTRNFNAATLRCRDLESEFLEPDDLDKRYKAGFFRQDRTFLECVRDGKALTFPACSLDDAVKTMEMIDEIAGSGRGEP